MRTFALFLLLLLLVAGVAGAQPATTNCRSSATPCSAASMSSGTTFFTRLTGSTGVVYGSGPTTGIGVDTGAGHVQLYSSSVAQWYVNGANGAWQSDQGRNALTGGTYRSTITSGSNGFEIGTSGAWFDLGGGSNDRIKSDGTNVLVDTTFMPVTDKTQDLGGSSNTWGLAWLDKGVILSRSLTPTWTTAPISTNAEVASQVLFNASVPEPAYATSSRPYNSLGQAKEWAVEKRSMVADIGFESTTCPTASAIRGTGAGAVTFACTDAAAATNVTLSGESYRQSNTTAVSATVSIVDVSAATTKLELGPKLIQRVSIPAASNTSVRIWVALVPIATSLTGVDTGAISVVGFRFSTAVPDTNWQACSGGGASVACTDTGIAPTTATNLVLEIDCREASTCRFLINGSLVATRSSSLPTSTTQLGQRVLVQTLTTAAKGLGYGRSNLLTN